MERSGDAREMLYLTKYCERHISRGRHRSRKPVEGQIGHIVSGSTTTKVVPIASSQSASVISSGGASYNLGAMQHQFNSLLPRSANPSTNTLVSSDRAKHDQHPLGHFFGNWPKDHSDRASVAWIEQLKSDWTQLSMSTPIPMASSGFSSSSNSPPQDKVTLSPLRLSRDFDSIHMGLGVSNNPREPDEKQTNWIPISSLGGPLGEVLNGTSSTLGANKNTSALNLVSEVWDGNPQLGSSPTGALQKVTNK
ncbi:unnamed protein product [Ilex paraguariensis]|uniref:Growth-regulating factor n=1 Tax=Ilex paraguariensis TaxID=185542 RepID=A0ABC8TEX8_9AQUA